MSDFGFVGPTYVAASTYQDDQECINFYPEIDPNKQQGERGVIALLPCPGLDFRVQLSPPAGVRQLYVLPGGTTMLAVAGNSLYSVDLKFNATFIGNLLTASGPVSIKDNGTSAYIADGPNRYYYTWGTSTFAVVSDGAFNGGNSVDIVDNFLIYNNPNSNQWGCTNVGSVVSSGLNVASMLSASGNIVGLIADHRDVYLLGEKTCEVWNNVGSFPFSFAVVPGTTMQHGCAARGSIARFGESFAFLCRDERGVATVVQMNGYQPMRISTHAVEQALNKYSVVSDAVAYTYQQNGHEFYVLTFPSQDTTWVYDLATQMWHKRAYVDSYGVYHRHLSNCHVVFGSENIVGDWSNGYLYALSQSTYTDNGQTMPALRRCRHITSDLKRQFFHDLQVQFQPGVGLQSGQGSDPKAMLRWSDDGGSTWSNERWASIGAVGKYKNRAIWRRLGWSRDRVFELTVSDPVFRAVVSANLNASVGAH